MNFKKRVNGSWTDTSHYIHNTSTDTLTTLPAVVYPNAATATVGLKGQAVQSSVPSPTPPVMPNGTGDKTANLCNITNVMFACGYSSNLISPDNFVEFSVNGNSITINVKETSHSAYVMIGFCENGGTYTVKTSTTSDKDWGVYATSSTQLPITFSDSSKFTTLVARNQNASKTFTVPQGFNYIWISTGAGRKYTVTISNIMLNTGSTALPFEPWGYKIPISSANTTTNIYLGEVQTTRKIKKLVLTGEEDWGYSSGGFYLATISDDYLRGAGQNYALCSHYATVGQTNSITNVPANSVSFSYGTGSQRLYVIDSAYSGASTTTFKTYLATQYAAGTPVTVWYVLAESTTGIVNEPIRKIGDYADTVSGITIPTITGANSFDVLTTLKPSEVTLNYKGWHTGAVHERDSGQWD